MIFDRRWCSVRPAAELISRGQQRRPLQDIPLRSSTSRDNALRLHPMLINFKDPPHCSFDLVRHDQPLGKNGLMLKGYRHEGTGSCPATEAP